MFKVGALVAALLLTVFYVAGLTRIPSRHTARLVPLFKKYQKAVKTVYTLVVILFTFTFFGTQAGEPQAKLKLRVGEAEGKYGELRDEVKDAVEHEVAKKLLEKVRHDLPPDSGKDLDDQDKYHTRYVALYHSYQNFRSKYGQRDAGADKVFNRWPPPAPPPRGGNKPGGQGPENPGGGPGTPGGGPASGGKPGSGPVKKDGGGDRERRPPGGAEDVGRTVFDLFEDDEPPAAAPAEAPAEAASVLNAPEASAEKIDVAKEAVRGLRERTRDEVVRLFNSEEGHELAVLAPKTFTARLKKATFDSLTETHPLAELILEPFVGTLNKELEGRTLEAVNRATASIAQNPAGASQAIEAESSKVAAETKIKFPAAFTERARAAVAALREKVRAVGDAASRLAERARGYDEKAEEVARAKEAARAEAAAIAEAERTAREAATYDIEEQIKLLACKNEAARKEAVKKLSAAGPKLTMNQVGRITVLLRNEGLRLRLSNSRPGYFETAPVNYYAAQAVSMMRSQYLSETSRLTAQLITSSVNSTTPARYFSYEEVTRHPEWVER